MSPRPLRLDETVGHPASDARAWLAFALEASGASRWEIALPGGSFSPTELWQRMSGDETATAIPRADLKRLREALPALLDGERAQVDFEFLHAGRDGRPERRRSVIRLVAADPATGRPQCLRGLNFPAPSPDADAGVLLRRAERQAEAMREFETYCHAIAHETRGPARAISGLAALLLERHASALPDDARRLADRIARAGRDLEGTLEGLSGLTRLARQELVLETVDLAALAREAWNALLPGDAAHAARLVVACTGAAPVRADRSLAQALVRNLLANAFKFSRGNPGSPVTFARDEGPPPHFVVRDEGAGFDLGAARNLFEPFGRQHTSSQFEGSGIGLAIVRRVVELHGGRVWAESQPGEGAAFHFTLPEA